MRTLLTIQAHQQITHRGVRRNTPARNTRTPCARPITHPNIIHHELPPGRGHLSPPPLPQLFLLSINDNNRLNAQQHPKPIRLNTPINQPLRNLHPKGMPTAHRNKLPNPGRFCRIQRNTDLHHRRLTRENLQPIRQPHRTTRSHAPRMQILQQLIERPRMKRRRPHTPAPPRANARAELPQQINRRKHP